MHKKDPKLELWQRHPKLAGVFFLLVAIVLSYCAITTELAYPAEPANASQGGAVYAPQPSGGTRCTASSSTTTGSGWFLRP